MAATSPEQQLRYRRLETTASMLESRLRSLQKHPNEYEDVFPIAAQTLYYHLLGKAYLEQFHQAGRVAYATFVEKSIMMVHEGVKTAIKRLEPANYERLLCVHTYCRLLSEVGQHPSKAKFVAERSFEEAVAYENLLDDRTLAILQRLRDDFMSKDLFQTNLKDPDYRPSETFQDGLEEIQELFASKPEGALDKKMSPTSAELIQHTSSNNAMLNAKLAVVRKLRRAVNVLRPVVLETLPSSLAIIRAIDSVFRAYIRGNALPGQLAGGNTVDFAGQTVSFRSFVLDGPYLSWKGFLCFLLDFHVAKAPAKNSKSGKHFLKSLTPAVRDAVLAAGEKSQDPLVSMTEAAALFLEASTSLSPALAMRKSLHVYTNMANEGAAQDSAAALMSWAEDISEKEWEIAGGLNFMQFVDCVGKIGVVGYSTPYFQEMLPTIPEKIEHFLSAYLGLADRGRWQFKVDQKLQAVKTAIAKLTQAPETSKASETKPLRKSLVPNS